MKWRQSLVYLVILLLVGGYFTYFEVIRKEQRQTDEREARKLFQVKSDSVQELEIFPKDKEPVHLSKHEGRWSIMKPVQTQVDAVNFDSLLSALTDLEAERVVEQTPQDLKPYGLQEPSLKIRFKIDEQWRELFLGDKNPVGDGYYGKTGDRADVLLIAQGHWAMLNKGADELRKRELFSFQPDEVVRLAVAWNDGNTVQVEAQGQDQEGNWKAAGQPEIGIKNSKVQNVIEQLQWLRAQEFLATDSLATQGLEPPLATVRLGLKDERTVELRLGKENAEKRRIAALSSELPFVVEVDSGIMKDLPRSLSALQDRDLLTIKPDDIQQIRWRLEDRQGHVARMEKDKWGSGGEGEELKPLRESWRPRSVLWKLAEIEYQEKLDVEAAPNAPETPYGRIELWDAEKKLWALSWPKPGDNDSESMVVWVERGESRQAVQMAVKPMRALQEELDHLKP